MVYLLKAGFSVNAVQKAKSHPKFNMEQQGSVAVSNLIPMFEQLGNTQQVHMSHYK